MKEPILSREKVLKIVRKTLKENNDRDKLSSDRFVALASALESAILEKLCGEPVAWLHRCPGCAWELSFPDDSGRCASEHSKAIPLYSIDDGHCHEMTSAAECPLYALNRSKA